LSGPETLSALAMLLAATFMRCDCAVRAEPAIAKIPLELLKFGMVLGPFLLVAGCWL
jgi:hypothetical protein